MKKNNTSRREFIKINSIGALGTALTSGILAGCVSTSNLSGTTNTSGIHSKKLIDEYDLSNPKLCHRFKPGWPEEEMQFLKQIGVKYVRVEFGLKEGSFEHIQSIQQKLAKYDIQMYSGTHSSYSTPLIGLGLPGRDKDIETYQAFLRNLGRLQIPIAAYSFHVATTYGTGTVQRRGYTAREFKLDEFRTKLEKQKFEREYSAEEIWSAYTYFMKAVLPVAEEANVKLALHPDDPPISKMNGVAKIFTDFAGYKRAEDISGTSKNWGLCFCVGTWAEGGDKMGKDVFEVIKYFGDKGKIQEIHFRNVTSPLPDFVETFPDDGYLDMYQVMKALRQVRFNGIVMPDHVPLLVGDQGMRRAGTAYVVAYMRALLRRANEEIG